MTLQIESPEAARKAGHESDDEAYRFGRPPENLPYLNPAVPTRITDTSGVELQRLDLAKKSDRVRFLDVADPIYEADPHYIAPLRLQMMKFLDPGHNPTFKTIRVQVWIAVQNGKDVGRITAQLDPSYDRYHETKSGFFGFFECINDRKVAHALLAQATEWLKQEGAEEIFGPMNFTTNHQAGLIVENFSRPAFVEETYNPQYYEELLTSFGFGKAKDLYVWWVDIAEGMETKNRKRIVKISERVKKREGITIRHADLGRVEEEMERIFELYMQAWQKNWGFVPLEKDEFLWLAQDIKEVAIPELVLFVEVGDRPVGFCTTLPNINERLPKNGRLLPFNWTKLIFGGIKKARHARLYVLGVLPEYRKRGLETLMFSETLLRAKDMGFEGGEVGWTLEDNDPINNAIKLMDGRLDRTYRILGLRTDRAP